MPSFGIGAGAPWPGSAKAFPCPLLLPVQVQRERKGHGSNLSYSGAQEQQQRHRAATSRAGHRSSARAALAIQAGPPAPHSSAPTGPRQIWSLLLCLHLKTCLQHCSCLTAIREGVLDSKFTSFTHQPHLLPPVSSALPDELCCDI